MEDFSGVFTVEIYESKGWEVVFVCLDEDKANERWLKELQEGRYVRVTSPNRT
jgi:hypothetical protein